MDVLHQWYQSARTGLPAGLEIWDGHTHTGQHDPDGVRGTSERLIEKLTEARQSGAVVMTNRNLGGYPDANDRILAEAERAEGRLVPFVRVDPRLGRDAVSEAIRGLDAGHRGIKLHPRGEQFSLSDATVRVVAKLAAERGVPVLVHAGRGIPSLGRDAAQLCAEADGLRLILAHAAISDLSWLGPSIGSHPGLYFDTAWWDVTDLLALLAWVPPGRIIYASDTPYGHPQLAFILTMRVAASAGYDPEQLGGLFGGTLLRLLDGKDGLDRGLAPVNRVVTIDPGLLRVHASLHGAIARAFTNHDATEAVSLARLGCEVPDDVHHAPVYHAIAAILDSVDLEHGSRSQVLRPLIVAAAAALTPDVAVPVL